MFKNRFRSVELGIFTVVSLVFLNSVYHLFTDGRFITNTSRQPLADLQVDPHAIRGPRPASVTESQPAPPSNAFLPYALKCVSQETFETAAPKIRLNGSYCGQPTGDAKEFKVENITSHYTGTVLSDHQAKTFSTDIIPLEHGINKLVMQFIYKNGKSFPVELTISRK